MQEVFEKIIEKLENKIFSAELYGNEWNGQTVDNLLLLGDVRDIIEQAAEEYDNGWIPCSQMMPKVETEVFILAKRKFKDGDFRYIRTTAMYEDGTVSENDSCWFWQDIEGEWDEENDCYIIPEGWWENRHYNPDDVYNNVVDDEVVAWQPMPPEYQENGEHRKKTNFDRCCESIEAKGRS